MKKLILLLCLSAQAYAVGPIIGNVQISTNPLSTQSGGYNVQKGTHSVGFSLPYISGVQCLHTNTAGDVLGTGSDCGSGGSGSGNGAIVGVATQYGTPYYSVAGSSNTLAGLSPGTYGQLLTTQGAAGPPIWSNNVPPGSTNYAQITSALISGTTIYVASGTVANANARDLTVKYGITGATLTVSGQTTLGLLTVNGNELHTAIEVHNGNAFFAGPTSLASFTASSDSVITSTLTVSTIAISGLSPGLCVQTATGGRLTTTGGSCSSFSSGIVSPGTFTWRNTSFGVSVSTIQISSNSISGRTTTYADGSIEGVTRLDITGPSGGTPLTLIGTGSGGLASGIFAFDASFGNDTFDNFFGGLTMCTNGFGTAACGYASPGDTIFDTGAQNLVINNAINFGGAPNNAVNFLKATSSHTIVNTDPTSAYSFAVGTGAVLTPYYNFLVSTRGYVQVTSNTILSGTTIYKDNTASVPAGWLARGSGATSSTFWRGDETWASPGGGGQPIYPSTGMPTFPFGVLTSTIQVSSNTILNGSTFYANGPVNMGRTLNLSSAAVMGGSNAAIQITSNTIMQGATFYQDGHNVLGTTIDTPGTVPIHFLASTGFGIGMVAAQPLDVAGVGRASTNFTAPVFLQNTTAVPALVLQAAGANFGIVQNDGRIAWSLAFGASSTANGTKVLGWDSTPNVTVYSSMTVANTSAAQKWIMTNSTSTNGPWAMAVSTTNHLNFQDQQSSPVISGCGTQPSFIGSDTSLTVTVGSGAGGCTVTFAQPFKINTPICIYSLDTVSLVNAPSTTTSLTAWTITETSLSGKVSLHCFGRDP